jgi:hypothetical protein
VGITLLCSASTPYVGSVGNPAGSIATRVDITLNLLGAFQGSGTWVSPAFTVPGGQPVSGATFGYDRRLDAGGLLSLQPKSTVVVTLVDETAASATTLLTEQLPSSATSFAQRTASAPAGAVVAGHTYRLRLETTTTSTVVGVGVVGAANTRFDNIALTVDQGSPGGGDGEGGAVVSPGVTITQESLSDRQTSLLFSRYDETTERGSGPGGSVIAQAACTIVGTAGRDRIIGTRGNDVICGLGGDDVISGAGGNDIIDGAAGSDRLSGGSAKDKLIGLQGNDRLKGNAGRDRAGGGAGRDRLSGAAGNDRLAGGSAGDRLRGGRGRDRLLGAGGSDRFGARDGKVDIVDGGKGRDRAVTDTAARAAKGKRRPRVVDRVRGVERRG